MTSPNSQTQMNWNRAPAKSTPTGSLLPPILSPLSSLAFNPNEGPTKGGKLRRKVLDEFNVEICSKIRGIMVNILGTIAERPLAARILLAQLDRRIQIGVARSLDRAKSAALTLRDQLTKVENAFLEGDNDRDSAHRASLAQTVRALLEDKSTITTATHTIEEIEQRLFLQDDNNLRRKAFLINAQHPGRAPTISTHLRRILAKPDARKFLLEEEFDSEALESPRTQRSDADHFKVFSHLACESVDTFHSAIQRVRDLEASLIEPLHAIVTANYPLARWQATRSKWMLREFGGTGRLELDDLVQVAMTGISRAARRFNPERAKFSTYAMQWIKQAIQREVHNAGSIIHIPIYKQHGMKAGSLACSDQDPPPASVPFVSTESDYPEREGTITPAASQLAPEEDPLSELMLHESTAKIRKLLKYLDPTESYIIQRLFGLDDRPAENQKTLAIRFDKSKTWVYHEVQSALSKLREVASVVLETEVAELMANTRPESEEGAVPRSRRGVDSISPE